MRFAALGMSHEADTFAPVAATMARFEAAGIPEGTEIVREYADSQATLGEFLALPESFPEAEVVPSCSRASPPWERSPRTLSSPWSVGCWSSSSVKALGMPCCSRCTESPSPSGTSRRTGDRTEGPRSGRTEIPIDVSLDMHANVSSMPLGDADVVTIYLTNPHVAAWPCGLRAPELVYRTVLREIRPTSALEKPPLTINILRQGRTVRRCGISWP